MLLLVGGSCTSVNFGQEFPNSANTEDAIQVSRIMEDIRMLSSPGFQGRQAGTPGGELSADFVAQRFHALGLQFPFLPTKEQLPIPWQQSSPLTASNISEAARLTFFPTEPSMKQDSLFLIPGKDFLPIFDSPSVNLTAPVVFVGYGIVDPARGMDHYHGLDVHNRIVLALRGKPPTYRQWVTQEKKVQTAKEHGAAGLILLTGPLLDPYESRKGLDRLPRAGYAAGAEFRPIPTVWLDGAAGEYLFETIGLSLQHLQTTCNEETDTLPQPLPLVAHLQWTSHSTSGSLINILGIIPGQDPAMEDGMIIVGAHRDHFGAQAGMTFPGADDNASGTAVMLEVARVLSHRPTPLQHNIMFISFDGEERGLLGSRLYVNNPAFPLARTTAMINLDHVGVGNGKLTIGVTRRETEQIQFAAEQAGLAQHIQLYGYFPGGDHVPFFEAGVPTITIVSSGIHPHFHQSSDTADTIQPELLETTSRFLLSLILRLADSP
jgi:hypothetical protein